MKIISTKIIKRKFTAKKYKKGSPMRRKLNKDVLTSEYMPSEKYTLYQKVKFGHGGVGLLKKGYRTKTAAEISRNKL